MQMTLDDQYAYGMITSIYLKMFDSPRIRKTNLVVQIFYIVYKMYVHVYICTYTSTYVHESNESILQNIHKNERTEVKK